jgi:hypothetical protein
MSTKTRSAQDQVNSKRSLLRAARVSRSFMYGNGRFDRVSLLVEAPLSGEVATDERAVRARDFD